MQIILNHNVCPAPEPLKFHTQHKPPFAFMMAPCIYTNKYFLIFNVMINASKWKIYIFVLFGVFIARIIFIFQY